MDNKFVKVTKGFVLLFMAAAVVLTALVIGNAEEFVTDRALADKILNPTFALGFILLGLGVLSTLAFSVARMISIPKLAVRALISLGLLGVIYLMAYLFASDATDAQVYIDFDINSTQSKLIGSLIYLVYILGGLSIAAIIYSGVNKLLLKR